MKTIVLGGGRVGGAIARDLAADPDLQVTVADLSDATRQRFTADGFDTLAVDFADPAAIREATQGFDLAIGAVPGFLGFDALRAVLEAGTSIADISFFAEDPFELDALAKENGVTAVVDCGIAPGCGNLILGHLIATQDRVERFDCFVGGLPSLRTWPYEYKAGFSPIDVIEEYTRPARLRER